MQFENAKWRHNIRNASIKMRIITCENGHVLLHNVKKDPKYFMKTEKQKWIQLQRYNYYTLLWSLYFLMYYKKNQHTKYQLTMFVCLLIYKFFCRSIFPLKNILIFFFIFFHFLEFDFFQLGQPNPSGWILSIIYLLNSFKYKYISNRSFYVTSRIYLCKCYVFWVFRRKRQQKTISENVIWMWKKKWILKNHV